jgi:protein-tyrosine phosphatase
MPSILFVCTANRFRSPLAAAFLRKNLEGQADAEGWDVASAGTWTTPGLPVMPGLVDAARRYGIDLSDHRSRRATRSLLSRSDLIVVMQAGHREALLTEDPTLQQRIRLLSEVVEHRTYDILDSPGSDRQALELVAELEALIRQGASSLCALAADLSNTRQTLPSRHG